MSAPNLPLSFSSQRDESVTFTTLIAPIGNELLYALVATLTRHFSYRHDEWKQCVETLSPYPEDLVCAAYYRVMRLPATPCATLLKSMTDFMSPELQFRIMRHHLIATYTEEV